MATIKVTIVEELHWNCLGAETPEHVMSEHEDTGEAVDNDEPKSPIADDEQPKSPEAEQIPSPVNNAEPIGNVSSDEDEPVVLKRKSKAQITDS